MAKLYSAEGTGSRCPGESCPRFRSTKGKPPDVQRKILDTCARCRGNAPLECATEGKSDDEVTAMVANIERLARERDTCGSLDVSEIDAEEFECLLIWDAAVKAHERAHQARTAQLFEWLVSQFQASRSTK